MDRAGRAKDQPSDRRVLRVAPARWSVRQGLVDTQQCTARRDSDGDGDGDGDSRRLCIPASLRYFISY